ncbi:hypothetical protein HRbin19_00700 [bacterium HR19]|nr:hypothetical protein HRbin19_00700 [bacterium HR19]
MIKILNKSKSIIFSVIAMVVFSFPNLLYAQETGQADKIGGVAYFILGGKILNLSSLNTRLESKGYPKISNNFISLGGGGHFAVKRFIIGGEGHGFFSKETENIGYRASVGGGYGFFNIGYIVYRTEGLNVYPLLGLGGGAMTLELVEKAISPSFDDLLSNPRGQANLSVGGFLINLAVGLDYFLALRRGERGEGGLDFGLRLGYIFSPFMGSWRMSGAGVSGGPSVAPTGPFIRLTIGGGGFGEEK